MPDLLTLYAAADPDKPGVIEDGNVLTYGAFEARANQVAAALQQLGVRAGTKLVWCAQNSTEVVVIINAARKTGAVAVPLNYRLSTDEAAYVIDNSDATVVLFDVEQIGQLEGAVERCPKVTRWAAFHGPADQTPSWAEHLPSLADAQPTSEVEPLEGTEDSGGTMIYTSGTTGKPKGALRRGRPDAAASGAALVQLIGYQPGDVYLTTGPLYHSGPLGFMGIVQLMGGTIIVQRHFDAEDWLRLVDQYKVTTTFSAPTPLRRVVDLPEDVRKKYDYSSMSRSQSSATKCRCTTMVPPMSCTMPMKPSGPEWYSGPVVRYTSVGS
jgi:fatty-acyl-CoA synthase/long-chain acyl-CoA synthetase